MVPNGVPTGTYQPTYVRLVGYRFVIHYYDTLPLKGLSHEMEGV